MYVGTQLGGDQFAKVGDRYLRQLAQLGVKHVCIDPVGDPWQWDRDILMRHAEHVSKFGLVLDMVQLPLPSSGIERNHQAPGIVPGPGNGAETDCPFRVEWNLAAFSQAGFHLST